MEPNKPLILVADDQQLNQKLISLILGKLGYDSISADDGTDAVEKAQAFKPALIFMDLQMPNMSGCEAAEKLRALGFQAPIIAVTGADFPDEKENCLKAGMNGILFKPVKRADIEKTLEKWLGGGDRSAAPAAEKPASLPRENLRVFNAEELLDNFMNNKEAVWPLLARFISRTREQLAGMANPANGAGGDTLRNIHMIRGAALTMGGAELGRTAAVLEAAYSGTAKDKIGAAYRELREAFENFTKEAEEFIREES